MVFKTECLMRTGEWAGKLDSKYRAFILPDGSDASSYENVKWFNEVFNFVKLIVITIY